MKKCKTLRILFCILCPIVGLCVLYVLLIRCRQNHSWPDGMKKIRYAHRGLHDEERPENSLAAFRNAIEHGYGAELDVHLTKDGELAVIHDSSLLRTAGADVCVEDLTVAELKQYRLGDTEETIPLLSEVLEVFEGKTPLIIELKPARGNYNALTCTACDLLRNYHVDYCIESFDPRCLIWLRKNCPDIVRGQLSGNLLKDESDETALSRFLVSYLLTNFAAQPDFVAYDCRYRCNLSLKLCRLLYHVQEVSWTVRDPETMAKLEAEGNLVIFENFGW